VTDRFDVVAVRITHEGAVIGLVVLRPEPRLVQYLAPNAVAASKKALTAARSGALKAMWDSRKPAPELNSPIQKSGWPGRP